ncbi:MAG: hypothetical protein COB46_08910 [Rhodospirillaceae bacterium]|nr:MAG: hypothetical protein COB46_08910 [Rhodospirillaceae bacterium]
MFKTNSLLAKLLAYYVPMVGLSVLVLFGALEYLYYQQERASLIVSLNRTAAVQQSALGNALWEYDLDQVSSLVSEIGKLPYIHAMEVFDASDQSISKVGDTHISAEVVDFELDIPITYRTGKIEETVGRIVISVHSDLIKNNVSKHLKTNALILLVLMLTLIVVTWFVTQRIILRPIYHLRSSIKRMDEERVWEPVDWPSRDEIGNVISAFNGMQEKQISTEETLIQHADELRQSETNLKDKIEEVERFNRLAMGRELRVIELKTKANGLSEELGRDKLFSSVDQVDDTPDPDQLPALPTVTTREHFLELLQAENIQKLFESFCEAVGVPAAIIDLEANILAQSHWQKACTDFHRVNEDTCKRCIESDTDLALRLNDGEKFAIYNCKNGLTDSAAPIIVDGVHIANVFIGQFFLKAPDLKFFAAQAKEFGFDEKEYLAAISEAPIVDEDKLPAILGFLTEFADLVASMSLSSIKAVDAQGTLRKERSAAMSLAEDAELARVELADYQEHLEDLVKERTVEVQQQRDLIKAVMDSMTVGIAAFDKDLKLIAWNKPFVEIRGYPEDMLDRAPTFEQMTRYDIGKLEFGEGDPELIFNEKIALAKKFAPHAFDRQRPNGMFIEVRGGPIEGGGFVSMYADITERKQSQNKLADAYSVISDSIDYAARIQRSVLPDEASFSSVLSDHFVWWEPRDIVGGDIYWSRLWGDGYLIILGDCTGHGVPGAFMTLIATGALDNALSDIAGGQVAKLMQRLHQLVQMTLGQHGNKGESDDGMELGMCYISAEMDSVTFVGARFELNLLENGNITVIKGTKSGIGYRGIDHNQDYEEHEIVNLRNKSFYMTSDGLVDQVGGERGRMFGKKRFRKLLLDVQDLPMSKQKESIREALITYQGAQRRRDDVAVFGFKIQDDT